MRFPEFLNYFSCIIIIIIHFVFNSKVSSGRDAFFDLNIFSEESGLKTKLTLKLQTIIVTLMALLATILPGLKCSKWTIL